MQSQSTNKVIDCYNATAENYANQFSDELTKKHFDQLILNAFAIQNKHKGMIADFGCGPGQTTQFLYKCGANQILGIDISPKMIEKATQLYPDINFEVGNLLNLKYTTDHFEAAIAFYAIVHFTMDQLEIALQETYRVLRPGGQFLFSFHVGNEVIHKDSFLDQDVDIDFYFFETEQVTALLGKIGFNIIDIIERQPYPDVEYPSKRAYIWVEK